MSDDRGVKTPVKTPVSVIVYWVAVVVLLISAVVLLSEASKEKALFQGHLPLTAAGALAAITGGSLVIERIIEFLWTFIDLTAAHGWPTGIPLTRLETALDTAKQVITEAKTLLTEGKAKSNQDIDTLQSRIKTARGVLVELKTISGGSFPKATETFTKVDKALNTLSTNVKKDEVTAEFDSALHAIDEMSALVDAVSSNPARRFLSIIIGVCIGLLGAWALGLNVYSAVNPGPDGKPTIEPNVWVAITGLVMGLGSTPTHELISFLQKRKQAAGAAATASAIAKS